MLFPIHTSLCLKQGCLFSLFLTLNNSHQNEAIAILGDFKQESPIELAEQILTTLAASTITNGLTKNFDSGQHRTDIHLARHLMPTGQAFPVTFPWREP